MASVDLVLPRSGPAEASFDELCVEHRGPVLRLCRLLLAEPDEADDVAQEVLLKLHRHRARLAPDSNLRAWLTTVTIHACRDRRRSRWWRLWRASIGEVVEDRLCSPAAGPEDQVLAREVRVRIHRAYAALPLRQREVFLLRQVEGFSTEETGDMLGITTGSVKRHLYRALLRLRSQVGDLR